MQLASLRQLYVKELSDLHSAETQLVKALPEMAKAASSPELASAFQKHLAETQEHVRRLDQVFARMNDKPLHVKCRGMEGLLSEGDEAMKDSGDPAVKDAGLISIAQRVEHYEIAGYGCARTYAELLGEQESVGLLQTTLEEERRTDESLTDLAQRTINLEAAQA